VTTTKGVGASETGRVRAPVRARHGKHAPPTSWRLGPPRGGRPSRVATMASAVEVGSELVAWVRTEAFRRRREDAGTEARWIVPRGSVDTAALSGLPARWFASDGRPRRDDRSGMNGSERKGASGLIEAVSFTRRGGDDLDRPGHDPGPLRVASGPTPTDIRSVGGPCSEHLRTSCGGYGASVTKRQRYAEYGARRRNAPRQSGRPAEARFSA